MRSPLKGMGNGDWGMELKNCELWMVDGEKGMELKDDLKSFSWDPRIREDDVPYYGIIALGFRP